MAAQYSPPHEHMVPSWPLPPVLPYTPLSVPMTPPFANEVGPFPVLPMPTAQVNPHPNFFPIFFGHPQSTAGMPPPMVGAPYPPLYYQDGAANVARQNVGYVPIYPTIPTAPQDPDIISPFKDMTCHVPQPPVESVVNVPVEPPQLRHRSPSVPLVQSQTRHRSPSLPSVHSQQSIKAEVNSQPSQSLSSGSRSGSGSVLKTVELREEKGVLKAVYDPEDLRRYQEERGYINPNQEPAGINQPVPVPNSNAEYHPDSVNQSSGASHQEPEIIRPQSSPQYTPRENTEFVNPDEYISMPRRGSLVPAHMVRSRQKEVLTPIPIPFSNPQPQQPFQDHDGQVYFPHQRFQQPYGHPHAQAYKKLMVKSNDIKENSQGPGVMDSR